MAVNQNGKTVAEEYIISIIPELDREKFDKNKQKVARELNKVVREKNREITADTKQVKLEYQKERLEAQKAKTIKAQNLAKQSQIRLDAISDRNESVAIAGKVSIIVAAMKLIYEIMSGISEQAQTFSNKMISGSSAFVDKNTRQLMATFGVSGQTATGLGSVMNLMGLSSSDLKLMTPGQMQLFGRLMTQWQTGMDSIDPQALDKFQTVMQGFQSEMASAKLQLQIELYKLLVDLAPEMEFFFNQIINLVKSFAGFINSPFAKGFLGTLFDFVGLLIKCVAAIFQALSGDFKGAWDTLTTNVSEISGSSGSTYNNKTVIITQNSQNSYNGDTNSMYGMATSTFETESNIIASTYLK